MRDAVTVCSKLISEIHAKAVQAEVVAWYVIRGDVVVAVLIIVSAKVVQTQADIMAMQVYAVLKSSVRVLKTVIQEGNYFGMDYHVVEIPLPHGVSEVIVLLAGNENDEKARQICGLSGVATSNSVFAMAKKVSDETNVEMDVVVLANTVSGKQILLGVFIGLQDRTEVPLILVNHLVLDDVKPAVVVFSGVDYMVGADEVVVVMDDYYLEMRVFVWD